MEPNITNIIPGPLMSNSPPNISNIPPMKTTPYIPLMIPNVTPVKLIQNLHMKPLHVNYLQEINTKQQPKFNISYSYNCKLHHK